MRINEVAEWVAAGGWKNVAVCGLPASLAYAIRGIGVRCEQIERPGPWHDLVLCSREAEWLVRGALQKRVLPVIVVNLS